MDDAPEPRLTGEPACGPLGPGGRLGPYRILKLVGSGGMGDVYHAWDSRLERHVALKVLNERSVARGLERRFVQEAKAAAALNHPNIAQIYDIAEADGLCYIAMEYIDGCTLRRKMAESGLPELLGYMRQVAEGLGKAHAAGVIHCDLKPDNIMVTRDGAAKILDFGLAKLIHGYRREEPASHAVPSDAPTASAPVAAFAGTPGYMSPEQVEGEPAIDERSDIFSFGCILFEILARGRPLKGEPMRRTLCRLVLEPAPRIAEFCRNIPAALEDLVEGCLEKHRSRRYSSMNQVSLRLQLAMGALEQPRFATAVGRVMHRSVRWASRSGGKIWVSALVAVLAAAVLYVREFRRPTVSSVAVIPFSIARGAPDSEYLAEGLSEGLINALTRLPEVKVIARSSSFRFRSAGLDVRATSRALGVGTLVTGSVAEVGDALRIAVEIVNGVDGIQTWSRRYNVPRAELPQAEARIFRDVAERLRSGLPRAAIEKLSARPRVDLQAYDFVLRGRYQMGLYTPESRANAVAQFQQALAIDSNYAVANAELARAYRILSGSAVLDPEDAMPKASAAVAKALAIDPDLAEAHAALGDILKDQWKWSEAEREYRRALELNPNLTAATQGLAILLTVVNRRTEALAQIRRARDLSPLGLETDIIAAAVHYNLRQYDEALRVLTRARQSDPAAPAVWTWLGIVNGGSGRYGEAVAAFEKAFAFHDDTSATRCYYGYSLARSGRRAEAAQTLRALLEGNRFVPPTALAIVYTGLEQKERAIESIERAYASRDPLLQYMTVESHLDNLSDDQRFRTLARKIGLMQ